MARDWQVIDQDPGLVKVGSRYTPGVRVTYRDSTGHEDYVELTNDDYADPAKVKAAIAARIAQHEAVAGLSSGG